jgi:hypothetical protein
MVGVSLGAPAPVIPGNGATVQDKDQPITFLMANPETNTPRTVSIRVQVASDAAFTAIVYSVDGVPPGPNGGTKYLLPSKLASGHTYYWRAQATDGANTSDWSSPVKFDVLTPVVLGVPDPKSPIGNVRVDSVTPTLEATNGVSSGPHDPLYYNFQISTASSFSSMFTNAEVPEGSGTTKYTMPPVPAYDVTLYWRVRILDTWSAGAWSRVESFRSPKAPATPTPGPTPGPGPTGGGGSCASNDGPTIINCISNKYWDKLAAGVSASQRVANMAFLRDRVIEAGICGGLKLGLNLKRGGPEISNDFIARDDGSAGTAGIDIGVAYDDTSIPLRLWWGDLGYNAFAVFKAYPSFSCSGV